MTVTMLGWLSCDGACLPPEPLDVLLVLREMRVQDLDRDLAVEELVVRLVDARHPAFPDQFEQLVAAGDDLAPAWEGGYSRTKPGLPYGSPPRAPRAEYREARASACRGARCTPRRRARTWRKARAGRARTRSPGPRPVDQEDLHRPEHEEPEVDQDPPPHALVATSAPRNTNASEPWMTRPPTKPCMSSASPRPSHTRR